TASAVPVHDDIAYTTYSSVWLEISMADFVPGVVYPDQDEIILVLQCFVRAKGVGGGRRRRKRRKWAVAAEQLDSICNDGIQSTINTCRYALNNQNLSCFFSISKYDGPVCRTGIRIN
ncbi:MAG: hypothetical protein J4G05_12550, partial [Chlorobi bacterium]|nr:hypothetical protein [Chlorobiota bacterium]